jgi:hypothetical protein
MMAQQTAENLEDLVRRLKEAAEENGTKISVGEIIESIGHRSFGPLIVLGGLLGMSPLGLIPTAPTVIALLVLLVALQLVVGRETIWVPAILRKLAVTSEKLQKAAQAALKPVRIVDRIVKPRLAFLTTGPAERLAALACALAAVAMPPLELVPFGGLVPATAITIFGIALIARDGLAMLAALLLTAGAAGLIAYGLLR